MIGGTSQKQNMLKVILSNYLVNSTMLWKVIEEKLIVVIFEGLLLTGKDF
jgi:hypothetical protein